MNTATKEPTSNQCGAMNPIYGPSNTIPTICMSLYPANASNPPKKPSTDATTKATSSFRKLIPIISGLLTFATVLSILIIFMDTSGKCSPLNHIHCGYESTINTKFKIHINYLLSPQKMKSARNPFAKVPFKHDT